MDVVSCLRSDETITPAPQLRLSQPPADRDIVAVTGESSCANERLRPINPPACVREERHPPTKPRRWPTSSPTTAKPTRSVVLSRTIRLKRQQTSPRPTSDDDSADKEAGNPATARQAHSLFADGDKPDKVHRKVPDKGREVTAPHGPGDSSWSWEAIPQCPLRGLAPGKQAPDRRPIGSLLQSWQWCPG